MRFKQYQAGGAIYTPFISSRGTSQGQVSPSITTSTSSSKSEKADNKIRDEIVKVLQESGINNDVDSFLQVANDFLVRSRSLSNTSLFGGSDDSYSISDLTYVLSLANKVKQNKLQWDAAATNLKDQDNAHEVAVASNGYLYVRSEDGFATVSPDEFANNRDKYDALTNSQVLGLRQKLPGLAFNTDILNDMAGSISLETIQKQLLDIIDKFGETTRSEYVKRTGDNVSQSAWNGMRILIDQGPEGYYKVTNKTDLVNVESALDYLWKSLGADGQKRLRAEVVISGGDPTKNRYDLIAQMLEHHTSFTQDPSFDSAASNFDPDGDKMGNSGSSSSEVTDTLAEKYTSGSGAPPPRYEILMTSKSGVPMYAFTQDLGPVLNADGKSAKGNANLEDVLTNGYGLTTVDKRSITFGDQLIDWADANKIVYDASTNLKRVYLPATKVNGRITPDFEMYNKISELNESVKDQGLNDDQIAKLVESTYPNLTYNRNTGLIEAKNTQLFFTFGAIASTDTYGKDIKNSDWRIEQSDEVDRSWQNIYNRLTGYSTNSSTTKGTETGNRETGNGFMPWNWGYKFYKGNVFIPVIEPMLASTIYNDQYWPKEDYRYMTQKAEAQARQQVRESASNIITGF